jgi:LysR family transcriptional regulator, pca operon transcriptional activator
MQARLTRHITNLLHLSTVVECGSINRAAGLLGMTQPALTRSIARLEEVMEVQLLHRTSRGVVPTECGRALIERVRAADVELQRATDTIKTMKGQIEGKITCGAGPVSMYFLIPSAVGEFRRQRPRMHFHLIEDHTPALLARLRRRELDLVVGLKVDDEDDPDLLVENLVEEQIGIIARTEHPTVRGTDTRLKDLLANQQWVLPSPDVFICQMFYKEMERLGVGAPHHYVETLSFPAIRYLVREVDYIALSTSLLFGAEIVNGSVQMLGGDWRLPRSRTVIYRRKRDQLSPFVSSFINLIKQTTKQWRHPLEGAPPADVGFGRAV